MAVVALIFITLIYSGRIGDDMQLHASLPMHVNFENSGKLALSQGVSEIRIVEALGKVYFVETPRQVVHYLMPVMLIAMSIMAYGLLVFRKFIVNVFKGIIFAYDNIKLLKRMSYIILVMWGFAVIYVRLFYFLIAKYITIDSAEIVHDYQNFLGLLIVSLFLWMLAHIFKVGLDIQNENKLTI